jgi:hypothetical protein
MLDPLHPSSENVLGKEIWARRWMTSIISINHMESIRINGSSFDEGERKFVLKSIDVQEHVVSRVIE